MPCPAIQVLEQQSKPYLRSVVLPRTNQEPVSAFANNWCCATIAGSLAGGRDRAGDGAATGLRGCGRGRYTIAIAGVQAIIWYENCN
jgi:hypothetical protein